MSDIKLALDEETARWVLETAAKREISASQLIVDLLREEVRRWQSSDGKRRTLREQIYGEGFR